MKLSTIFAVACVLLTGCGHVYWVRKSAVEAISTSPEKYRSKRVVVTGWGIEGFELSALYTTREDAIALRGPKIDVNQNSWPWDTTDPFRHTFPYKYRLARVRVEGTVLYWPKLQQSPTLIDCIVVAESKYEDLVLEAK